VKLYAIHQGLPADISFKPGPATVSFTVPEIKAYAFIVVSW